MPPKGSGVKTVLPECLTVNSDKSKAYCVICNVGGAVPHASSSAWMSIRHAAGHTDKDGHKKAADNIRTTQIEAEVRKQAAAAREQCLAQSNKNISSTDPRSVSLTERTGNTEPLLEYDFNPDDFVFQSDVYRNHQENEHLRHEINEMGLWNAQSMADVLGLVDDAQYLEDEIDEDAQFAEIMAGIALDPPPTPGLEQDAAGTSSEFAPYDSRMMFLLDTLDNLPRLRVSNSLMRVFLWILRESGARDVPSFDRLRKVQTELRSTSGIPTIPCESVQGNIFFLNDPRSILAKDWSNPKTREHIHVYPEIPEDGIIREIWHAQKWRTDLDLDLLSPMYDSGSSHFYVNELAQMANGSLVIPKRWVTFRGSIYADALLVSINAESQASFSEKTTLISASNLALNYLSLKFKKILPQWTDDCSFVQSTMPNPRRIIAGGDPLYVSFVDFFGDDVSGNRSKSWNKHWNAYMTHRNLPRNLLHQEYHVHFISSSPNASISEQYLEFKAIAEETHQCPVKVRDNTTGLSMRFCITPNAGPSDNPMQAEIAANIGSKGNHPCRKCDVGGTQAEKRENEGFHAMFESGNPRNKETILAELEKQVHLACSGISQPIKDTQTATGVKDMYTQHWIDSLIHRFHSRKSMEGNTATDAEMTQDLIQWVVDNRDKIYSAFLTTKGFDPAKDTPVEILHTILLGIVKYIWHTSHSSWNTTQKTVYSTRLQSTNTDALSIHAIRSKYIMQYAGSLIGRQFKTLAQTNIFHMRGLVSDHQFNAWKAVGELSALLWMPAIHNLKEYLHDIKTAAANVLDIFAAMDATKIISKLKLHLLVHLEQDIIAFGPLVGVATEIFEGFNAVFRYCSILSNHLAPSRDIALQLADQEALKHRLTGGWWPGLGIGEDWSRAGPGVRQYFSDHSILQKLIGWSERCDLKPGSVKLAPLPKKATSRPVIKLHLTVAANALNFGDFDPNSTWMKGRYAVSESAEECLEASWVFVKSPLTDAILTGRVVGILCASEAHNDGVSMHLVCVEVYQVSSTRDVKYGMPVLTRRNDEVTSVLVSPQDIKFKFNAQHDCETAKCEATGERPIMQERVASGRVEKYIIHENLARYFINTHAFHNAHLLRATLPRQLTIPVPLFEDRRSFHDEMAAGMREKRTVKAAAKAKAVADKEGAENGLSTAAKVSKKRKRPQDDLPRDRAKRTKKTPKDTPALPTTSSNSLALGRTKRTVRASWKKQLADAVAEEDYDDDAPGPEGTDTESEDGSDYGT